MSKIAAIAAEYNPFHLGHAAQLCMLRERGFDTIIAIMSGQFVQRGEGAVLDCYTRAQAAVRGGVDLVVLLPYVYAAQTAELFAHGAVSLASSLGADALAFGCEDSGGKLLAAPASVLAEENEEYRTRLKRGLSSGLSFAKSREAALTELTGCEPELLRRPNNILALAYMVEGIKSRAPLEMLALPRLGAAHDALPEGGIASASYIRALLKSGDINAANGYLSVPLDTVSLPDDDSLALLCRYALLRLTESELCAVAEVEPGFIRRLLSKREKLSEGTAAFVEAVYSKRISRARVRRVLMNMLIGYTAENMRAFKFSTPSFALALAANARGRSFLRETEFNVSAQLHTDTFDKGCQDALLAEFEARAFELYSLLSPTSKPLYTRHMYVV